MRVYTLNMGAYAHIVKRTAGTRERGFMQVDTGAYTH